LDTRLACSYIQSPPSCTFRILYLQVGRSRLHQIVMAKPGRHWSAPGRGFYCNMRRIWAHKISLFVPRSRDVAHPGSGPAQGRLRAGSGRLRIGSGLLTLRAISGRLRRSIHNYFNSSRVSLELVPYIKMATLIPVFREQMVLPSLSFYDIVTTQVMTTREARASCR